METLYEKHFPLAQKYAKNRGGVLILEFFFWPVLLLSCVSIKQYYTFNLANYVLILSTFSLIFTGVFTSVVCRFFFCKNWKRMHIWYFKKQIEIQYTHAESFLSPQKTESIVQKNLKDYVEKRQSEILAEAHEEDIVRKDEYVDSELAILEASEPVLYKRFWNQTIRQGEAHLEQAEHIQKILEEFYGVVQ